MTNIQSNDPFESTAFTFSEGAFRAAAFAFGTITFLHKKQWKDKPFLERVTALSTVSGGTITGTSYAESMAKMKSFDEFSKNLFWILRKR